MKIYLDDDMDAHERIGLLEHEGHEVISSRRDMTHGQMARAVSHLESAGIALWRDPSRR